MHIRKPGRVAPMLGSANNFPETSLPGLTRQSITLNRLFFQARA
jgi:hypothetical protein